MNSTLEELYKVRKKLANYALTLIYSVYDPTFLFKVISKRIFVLETEKENTASDPNFCLLKTE